MQRRPPTPPRGSAALPPGRYTRASLSVLAPFLLVFTTASGLSHSESVKGWFHGRTVEHWRELNGTYSYRPGFTDVGGYLLLEAIPEADESQGGVTFLGASILCTSLMPWSLPEPAASLVRNYAVPGLSHSDLYQLTRFLSEHEGLLAGKRSRPVICLGLFYGDTPGTRHFSATFRYGLYDFDPERGIRPKRLWAPLAAWRRERGRNSHFLRECRTLRLDGDWRLDVTPRPAGRLSHPVEDYKAAWSANMEAAGPDTLRSGVDSIERLITFARQRDAEVVCILMPLGSWHRELPYAAEYGSLIRSLCDRMDVPLHDLTELLPDAEFADHSHPNHEGAWKTHRRLVEIAAPYLPPGTVTRSARGRESEHPLLGSTPQAALRATPGLRPRMSRAATR